MAKRLLISLSVILVSSAHASAQDCLAQPAVYDADDIPFSVRLCDLDSDGDLDAVTANDASDTVSVMINDGTGRFNALHRWPVGVAGLVFEPVDVDCCDFNGDDAVDLVAANRAADHVAILFNQGAKQGVPQFANPVHHPVGQAPWAVRCAPIDADSHWDIVTADFTSDAVSVLINDGTGGIAVAKSYARRVGDAPRSMALCDIDGDQDLDVMTANMSGKNITVLRNDGADGLTDLADTDLAVNPFALVCCDLDGVNGPDVVTANIVDDSVAILFNNGSGGFSGLTQMAGVDGAAAVACADLDVDGANDVITADLSGNSVSVFWNLKNGALAAPAAVLSAGNPSSVSSGRITGTNAPDLVLAFAEGVAVVPNICGFAADLNSDGRTNFADFGVFQSCFGGGGLEQCQSSDINGDGAVELGDHALLLDAINFANF